LVIACGQFCGDWNDIHNAKLGDTVQALDTGYVYRFDGVGWIYTQGYSATAIADVNNNVTILGTDVSSLDVRVTDNTAQLADTTTDLQQRGSNVITLGLKADGVTDDTILLQSIVNTYTGNLYFPEGTYKISSQIKITKPNIVLDFSPNAKIEYSGAGATTCFIFEGGVGTLSTVVTESVLEGTDTLKTEQIPEELKVNDWVKFVTLELMDTSQSYYYKVEFNKIKSIDITTNTIILHSKTVFGYDVTTHTLKIEKQNLLENVGISGGNVVDITSGLTTGISFLRCFNPQIINTRVIDFFRTGISLVDCVFGNVSNCYVQVSRDTDGLNYGVALSSSQYVIISNNNIHSFRTSIDVSGVSSFINVHGNVSFTGDVNTHVCIHVKISDNIVNDGYIYIRGTKVDVTNNYVRVFTNSPNNGMIFISEAALQGYIKIDGNTLEAPKNSPSEMGVNIIDGGEHISVINNVIRNVRVGIVVDRGTDTVISKNTLISNNQIINSNIFTTGVIGISCRRATDLSVIGNHLIGSGVGTGLLLWSSAVDGKFKNIIIQSNKINSFTTGLTLSANYNGVLATNNLISDCGTPINGTPTNSIIQSNLTT